MTTAFVLRLDKERAARLKAMARDRATTRNAILREALDTYLATNGSGKRTPAGRAKTRRKPASSEAGFKSKVLDELPAAKPGEGVGWTERLKELQALGRVIEGHPCDELREIDRNRW